MDGCYQEDPQLGLMPVIPLPYWFRRLRTLWRWRPGCLECKLIFKTEAEWQTHYVLTHIAPLPEDSE